MAFVYGDRTKEESSSVGLAAMVLTGAVVGFQDFATGVGNGNETYYTIFNGGDNTWEVGTGTYNAGSLTRNTVLASSNGGSAVNFAAGTKTVFATVAAQFFGSVLNSVSHSTTNHTGILGVPAAEAFTASQHTLVDHTALPFLLLNDAAHDAIDHTALPFSLLNPLAHSTLDHAGVTGVNSFDSTAHSNTNHFGILGVPGPESFTNLTHASTDHSGIPGIPLPGGGKVVQQVRNRTNTIITCNAGTPAYVNSIPQQTEGVEVITVSISPANTANILWIEFSGWGAGSQMQLITALFKDSDPDAIAVSHILDLWQFASGQELPTYLNHYLLAPSTAPQTYKIRIGGSGTWFVNGNSVGAAVFGGVGYANLTITEIAP